MQNKNDASSNKGRRLIDRITGTTTRRLGDSITLIKKTKIKTWQALCLVLFAGGITAAVVGSVVLNIETSSKAAVRHTSDLPDDTTGNQLHILYVLPSDRPDRSLDTNGTLARSVSAMQKWLADRANNKAFRLDTYQGTADITFYRLTRTDSQMVAYNARVRDEIESELKNAGLIRTNKIYAVYYDGKSNYACGGGAWPPTLPGRVAALYLYGAYGNVDCSRDSFSSDGRTAALNEFKMLHELFHTLGAVATCAPHHVLSGHVSDSPNDLMYAGNQPWRPSVLDFNRDDYYGHGRSDCLDLSKSSYLGVDTTPPTVPANFTATPTSRTSIRLAWSASTDNVGVKNYRLERCQGATCTNFVQVASPPGLSSNNAERTPNTTYRYRLRAVDAAGNVSGYSAIRTAKTLP